MALPIINDRPGKLPDIVTYLSGPLAINYVSANAVVFPQLKAKLVTLSSGRSVKYQSAETVVANTFLFKRATDGLSYHLRIPSAIIEEYAPKGPIHIELVLISGDSDLDDEPVALEKITFSADPIDLDSEVGNINLNINGSRFEVVFNVPGAGQTQTVGTLDDLQTLYTALVATGSFDPLDITVLADSTDGGKSVTYQLTPTTCRPYAYNDSPFS